MPLHTFTLHIASASLFYWAGHLLWTLILEVVHSMSVILHSGEHGHHRVLMETWQFNVNEETS
jgi:hypothetical protein